MRCAKCKKNEGTVDMGTESYGKENHPMICKPCRREWKKHCDILRDKYGASILIRHWKEEFERWIGYEWKGGEEFVVFT
jgi:protein-arginine kinase activator protein McsA